MWGVEGKDRVWVEGKDRVGGAVYLFVRQKHQKILITYPYRRGIRFVFDLASLFLSFFLSFFLDLFAHCVE